MIRLTRPVGVVVCTALLVVAASCTTRIESTTGVPGTASAGSSPTVGNYGSSVTTAPPTTALHLESSQLEKLLPTAAEIGPGYIVDPTGGEGGGGPSAKAQDDAVRKACPDYYELASEHSQVFTVAYRSEPAIAFRHFIDPAAREVMVQVGNGSDVAITKDTLDQLISALNSCDPIRLDDPESGTETTMKLRASPDTRYGDLGMVMSMDIDVSGGPLPRTIKRDGHVRQFQMGETFISITTIDGLDLETLRKVPVDFRLPSELAERIEGDLAELAGN